MEAGLRDPQTDLPGQAGLQITEAYEGAATAIKALSAATSWGETLSESWCLTIAALLAQEQNFLTAHAADVLALDRGAEEQ